LIRFEDLPMAMPLGLWNNPKTNAKNRAIFIRSAAD
jgi:hypothetical protein